MVGAGGRRVIGGGGGAGWTSDGVSLPGVFSRSGGDVGTSSAPSICGISLLTGEGVGEGLPGGGPEVAAVAGERTIFRFLLDRVSIFRAVAAGFPVMDGWGHATAAHGFCVGSE